MTNITSLHKRPYLTKEKVFDNLSEEIGDSDKVMMVALKENGDVVVFTTNNMTPGEEVFMSAYMNHGSINMAMTAGNINKFDEGTWL